MIMTVTSMVRPIRFCVLVVVLAVGNIVCAHDQIVKYSVGVCRFEKPGVLVQIQDEFASHLPGLK
jgi:hypothetical protein